MGSRPRSNCKGLLPAIIAGHGDLEEEEDEVAADPSLDFSFSAMLKE